MTYTADPKCAHCDVYPAEENGWCKKCVGVFGADYLGVIAKSHGADRIKELEIALIATDDALYWLLNLLHGMSKGGPEFSPPSNAEWTGAIGQGKEAHDIAEAALGGDT